MTDRSRILLALGLAAVLGTRPVPAFAATCTQCDRLLDLDEREWRCLQAQLPRLKASSTRFLFFSLGGAQCAGATQERTRNADTRLPPSSANAARVYRLTSDQLACIERNAARLKAAGSRYVIDFEKSCPEALSLK